MMTINVRLDKISDIREFVRRANKYTNLEIHQGRVIVPATSLMGIYSLDLENKIKVVSCDLDVTREQLETDFGWIMCD